MTRTQARKIMACRVKYCMCVRGNNGVCEHIYMLYQGWSCSFPLRRRSCCHSGYHSTLGMVLYHSCYCTVVLAAGMILPCMVPYPSPCMYRVRYIWTCSIMDVAGTGNRGQRENDSAYIPCPCPETATQRVLIQKHCVFSKIRSKQSTY